MSNLYVSQLVKVRINLDPVDLTKDYEKKIHDKIIRDYGDRCYLNGFIKRSSIDIVKIENGVRKGSHLHGFLTFNVEFTALFCVPKRDTKIICRIKQINKFGVMAHLYPMDVIVPRRLQEYGNMDLLQNINLDTLVEVHALDYSIEKNRVVVVGYITATNMTELNMCELPLDGLIARGNYDFQVDLKFSDQLPVPETKFGTNKDLNKLKEKIDPYNKETKPGSRITIWENIKKIISPYELIVYNSGKSGQNIIRYNAYDKIYDGTALYPVISRAFFKLWEILFDTKILDKYKNVPIYIANLAEGPGGFIQCLLTYRNFQHQQAWKGDVYKAITLKGETHNSWEFGESRKYFGKASSEGYSVDLSYGKSGDGDLINLDNIGHFTGSVGEHLCQLITADGGIEVTGEAYALQEYNNTKLFFAEILTALHNQAKNGALILKVYDVYYNTTVQMIHLLSIYYDKIIMIKPKTSRPANSEKYLVCTNFNGDHDNEEFTDSLRRLREMFEAWITSKKDVVNLFGFIEKANSSFAKSIYDFNKYNVDSQMAKISEGLELAMSGSYLDPTITETYRSTQQVRAKEWCDQYHIAHI
jgi:23S rRNA U2552 (ribose-2'-O)-methylase RlmE/FtsJ/DNA-directed RNA polymerase subunit E'/Rpb7